MPTSEPGHRSRRPGSRGGPEGPEGPSRPAPGPGPPRAGTPARARASTLPAMPVALETTSPARPPGSRTPLPGRRRGWRWGPRSAPRGAYRVEQHERAGAAGADGEAGAGRAGGVHGAVPARAGPGRCARRRRRGGWGRFFGAGRPDLAQGGGALRGPWAPPSWPGRKPRGDPRRARSASNPEARPSRRWRVSGTPRAPVTRCWTPCCGTCTTSVSARGRGARGRRGARGPGARGPAGLGLRRRRWQARRLSARNPVRALRPAPPPASCPRPERGDQPRCVGP